MMNRRHFFACLAGFTTGAAVTSDTPPVFIPYADNMEWITRDDIDRLKVAMDMSFGDPIFMTTYAGLVHVPRREATILIYRSTLTRR